MIRHALVLTAAAGLLACPAALAQHGPATAQSAGRAAADAAQQFAGQRSRARERSLEAVLEAIDQSGQADLNGLAELRDDAEKVRKAALTAAKKLASKRARKAKTNGDGERLELPFPVAIEYVWGARQLATTYTRKPSSRQQKATDIETMQALLDGQLPDADLLYARLLERLDNDRAIDPFAEFLAKWRNGNESFYAALDRTAGTNGSVFYFDQMLGEFVDSVVPSRHADRRALNKSLDASHHALHTAFLSYRQYRGLREAVALTIVLHPDEPLPGPLARYETVSPGGYSIRQQIEMLLLAADYDAMQVVDWIVKSAPPMPDNPWAQRYDPFTDGFQRVFQERLDDVLKHGNDTDVALQKALARHAELHESRRSAALEALTASAGDR